jgi:hypothetical protein
MVAVMTAVPLLVLVLNVVVATPLIFVVAVVEVKNP